MALIDSERPYNLMEALLAVHNSESNMQTSDNVITALCGIGQENVAAWLEGHEESYGEIMKEFSEWFLSHSHYQRESIDQDAAISTGLEMPED
jgi:hypothetical protein